MQSKLMSFVESLINVLVGFLVAMGAQIIVFPWFGIHIDVSQNFAIAVIFTAVSIARSYVLRRIFNYISQLSK